MRIQAVLAHTDQLVLRMSVGAGAPLPTEVQHQEVLRQGHAWPVRQGEGRAGLGLGSVRRPPPGKFESMRAAVAADSVSPPVVGGRGGLTTEPLFA